MQKTSHGILWQNARNLLYLKGDSFLKSKKIADSKLQTKKFLTDHRIAVPWTLGILSSHRENTFDFINSLTPPFVIKPNNWYGGKWILIIEEITADGRFRANSWEIYTTQNLHDHMNYIIDGFFSLSGKRDTVFIEKKIRLVQDLEILGSFWLPDIRVICYKMVPVMAMMRIPTQESEGKANLHSWACSAGIDIGTGKITSIYHKGKHTKSVPGIGDIRGITLPGWNDVLALTSGVQQVTGFPFLGCDIVLDDDDGALVLVMNVRPWLEVQNVTNAPLRARLDKIEGIDVQSVEKWVRLGRDMFSWEIEEKIKGISWKWVLWSREYIKIYHGEKTLQYIAQIRLWVDHGSISRTFARDILKIADEKTIFRGKSEILEKKKVLQFDIVEDQEENIVIGKNALRWFFIDPFKYKKWENPYFPHSQVAKGSNSIIQETQYEQLKMLDKRIMKIDAKIHLLQLVQPTNLQEQKQIFVEKKGQYIPKFIYQPPKIDYHDLIKQLESIEIPDIPLSLLYQRKKEEIFAKLRLVEAIDNQDTSAISEFSRFLFGDIHDEYFKKVKDILAEKWDILSDEESLDFTQIEELIKKFNHIYGIKLRLKSWNSAARFTLKWDTLVMREGSCVGKKEIRSIIAHEVEGHYLRRINGRRSDLRLFSRGSAQYIETDEWLAIYNQARFVGKNDAKYFSVFERYYFLHYAMKHSYKKLVAHLCEYYEYDYERVFTYLLRIKRGFEDPSKSGVFMKDAVYTNGYFSVIQALDSWLTMKELYVGKVHLDDIEYIKNQSRFEELIKESVIPFSV